MKSIILLELFLIVIASNKVEAEQQNKQHTFLVKTDLTKEQVETLLTQYHQKNNNQNETTSLKQKNLTDETTQLHLTEGEDVHKENKTQLKVKKEKHQKKNKKEKEPELNQTETVQETQITPETLGVPEVSEASESPEVEKVNLKKKSGKKEKSKKPEVSEAQEMHEVPEKPEAPEMENKTLVQTEKVNLKKKSGKKEKSKNPEESETPETSDNENKTQLLVNDTSVEELENETENENEIETDTIILTKKQKDQKPKQNGSTVLGLLSVILLCVTFISFFIYVTQPKKYSKLYKNSNNGLTDHLLVKDNINKEYDVRDF